jgi:hypothetical protein
MLYFKPRRIRSDTEAARRRLRRRINNTLKKPTTMPKKVAV